MFIKLTCVAKDKEERVGYINMSCIEYIMWDEEERCSTLKSNSAGMLGMPGGFSVRETPEEIISLMHQSRGH